MRPRHISNRWRVITAAVAVMTLLGGCTAAPKPDDAVRLDSLGPFVGANGLVSSLALSTFAPSSVGAVALGLEFDELTGTQPVSLDGSDWKDLWLQDSDERTWKFYYICDALGPDRAAEVVSADDREQILDEAMAYIDAFVRELEEGLDEQPNSLSAMVSIGAIWCLEGRDALSDYNAEQLLTAASGNAGLALQWRDVLVDVRGNGALRTVGESEWSSYFAAEMAEESCDDRSAIEAASLLILTAGEVPEPAGLADCAFDGSDSVDPQVVVLLARLANELPSLAEPYAERLSVASVRNDADQYGPRPVVSGTIQGTVLGLRLIRARSQTLVESQRAELMDILESLSVPGSTDPISLMQACILLDFSCDPQIEAGLATLQRALRSAPADVNTLEPLLAPLANAASVRQGEVTAMLSSLSARFDDPCVADQIAAFRYALEHEEWPDELSVSQLTRDLDHAVQHQDLPSYCNFSWLTMYVTPDHEADAPTTELPSTGGYVLLGDDYAPLIVTVTLEEYGAI